jgi:hypothetical protein
LRLWSTDNLSAIAQAKQEFGEQIAALGPRRRRLATSAKAWSFAGVMISC